MSRSRNDDNTIINATKLVEELEGLKESNKIQANLINGYQISLDSALKALSIVRNNRLDEATAATYVKDAPSHPLVKSVDDLMARLKNIQRYLEQRQTSSYGALSLQTLKDDLKNAMAKREKDPKQALDEIKAVVEALNSVTAKKEDVNSLIGLKSIASQAMTALEKKLATPYMEMPRSLPLQGKQAQEAKGTYGTITKNEPEPEATPYGGLQSFPDPRRKAMGSGALPQPDPAIQTISENEDPYGDLPPIKESSPGVKIIKKEQSKEATKPSTEQPGKPDKWAHMQSLLAQTRKQQPSQVPGNEPEKKAEEKQSPPKGRPF